MTPTPDQIIYTLHRRYGKEQDRVLSFRRVASDAGGVLLRSVYITTGGVWRFGIISVDVYGSRFTDRSRGREPHRCCAAVLILHTVTVPQRDTEHARCWFSSRYLWRPDSTKGNDVGARIYWDSDFRKAIRQWAVGDNPSSSGAGRVLTGDLLCSHLPYNLEHGAVLYSPTVGSVVSVNRGELSIDGSRIRDVCSQSQVALDSRSVVVARDVL